jgi:hypothetical protein
VPALPLSLKNLSGALFYPCFRPFSPRLLPFLPSRERAVSIDDAPPDWGLQAKSKVKD